MTSTAVNAAGQLPKAVARLRRVAHCGLRSL